MIRGARIAGRLAQRRLREGAIDDHVAVVPGTEGRGIQHGAFGQVPHLVLQEPEQRVGDDAVGGLLRAIARRRPGAAAHLPAAVRRSARDGSAATRRSPSLTAAASQVTGTFWPIWLSAVTSPPLLRRGRTPPSGAEANVTGPRFVAISRRRSPSSWRAAAARARARRPGGDAIGSEDAAGGDPQEAQDRVREEAQQQHAGHRQRRARTIRTDGARSVPDPPRHRACTCTRSRAGSRRPPARR